MIKTSQDNNLNYINFFKHFYEYHTEKLLNEEFATIVGVASFSHL